MALSNVITAYERLNHVLYEQGKSDREQYDVKLQKELCERRIAQLQQKTGKTVQFLLEKQEEILIRIAEELKMELKEQPQERVYVVKSEWAIEPDYYEQLEEVRCCAHLTVMTLLLTESIATIRISVEKCRDTCPINRFPILKIMVTMIF